MALVLAVEPDQRQAAILTRVIQERIMAELIVVDSRDAAIAALTARVPDVILLTALLSPRDEDEMVAHLRTLADADHVQTHTIPQLASAGLQAEAPAGSGGLLAKFRRKSKKEAPPIPGCDPAMFAEEVRAFLARAAELKSHAGKIVIARAPDAEAPRHEMAPAGSESDEQAPASSAWSSPFEWRRAEGGAEAVEARGDAPQTVDPPLVVPTPIAVAAEEDEQRREVDVREAQARARHDADEKERRRAEEEAQARAEEQTRAAAERERAEVEAAAERERVTLEALTAENERARLEAAEREDARLEAIAAAERERVAEETRNRVEAAERERVRLDAEAAEKERARLEAIAAAGRKRARIAEETRVRLAAEAAEQKRLKLAAIAAEKERARLEAIAAAELERVRVETEAAAERERARLAEETRIRLEAEAAERERVRLEAIATEKERARLEAVAAEERERVRLEAVAAAERERIRLEAEAAAAREEERLAAEVELEQRRIEEAAAARVRARTEREQRIMEAVAAARAADPFAEFRIGPNETPSLLRLMPLAFWARRESTAAERRLPASGLTVAPPAAETPADELRDLMAGLSLPAQVAGVSYARGCRIRRVRVPASAAIPRNQGAAPVILSKRALEQVRAGG